MPVIEAGKYSECSKKLDDWHEYLNDTSTKLDELFEEGYLDDSLTYQNHLVGIMKKEFKSIAGHYKTLNDHYQVPTHNNSIIDKWVEVRLQSIASHRFQSVESLRPIPLLIARLGGKSSADAQRGWLGHSFLR